MAAEREPYPRRLLVAYPPEPLHAPAGHRLHQFRGVLEDPAVGAEEPTGEVGAAVGVPDTGAAAAGLGRRPGEDRGLVTVDQARLQAGDPNDGAAGHILQGLLAAQPVDVIQAVSVIAEPRVDRD